MKGELVKYVGSEFSIPHHIIMDNLRRNFPDGLYRVEAEKIYPGCSEYLRWKWLRAIVRADISEDEYHKALRINKGIIDRTASLMPSVFRFFNANEEKNCAPLLSCIIDCVENAIIIEEYPQERVARRIAHETLKSTEISVKYFIENYRGIFDLIGNSFGSINCLSPSLSR